MKRAGALRRRRCAVGRNHEERQDHVRTERCNGEDQEGEAPNASSRLPGFIDFLRRHVGIGPEDRVDMKLADVRCDVE